MQCFNTKSDVLNYSCDLDFELLVFWLSLLWSLVVAIYAWSTIWTFFDLKQPQQPRIKISKLKGAFAQLIFLKNTFDFWHFLPEAEVKKVSNDWSGINCHYSRPHQAWSKVQYFTRAVQNITFCVRIPCIWFLSKSTHMLGSCYCFFLFSCTRK